MVTYLLKFTEEERKRLKIFAAKQNMTIKEVLLEGAELLMEVAKKNE